jgi:hypothetical protein
VFRVSGLIVVKNDDFPANETLLLLRKRINDAINEIEMI